MSAFSTEEILESFKFLPGLTLDRLLLVCRQWNHLRNRFEEQLPLRRLIVHIYSPSKGIRIAIHPSDIGADLKLKFARQNHAVWKKLQKNLEYSHSEKEVICPDGPHKALFSFLDSHIRNSAVSLSLESWIPPGQMCLIKDLIDGQIQRNCSVVSIIHTDYHNALNREISLIELLKASFMSADKCFSLIKPIKDANEVGQRMSSVEHCKVIFSTANRSQEPVQNFEVLWHFNRNFPDQFIEIFKNSRKEDWPEHIVVMPVGLTRLDNIGAPPDMDDLSKMERDGYPILENIWPNAKEICPDLSERPMEIVHPRNPEDGRRLTIEYTINLVNIYRGYPHWVPCYESSVTFKTI